MNSTNIPPVVAKQLFDLLEVVSRSARTNMALGGRAYFISDEHMEKARQLCATIEDPTTYVARQRAAGK